MSENKKEVLKPRRERRAEAKAKGEKFQPQYNGNPPVKAKFGE